MISIIIIITIITIIILIMMIMIIIIDIIIVIIIIIIIVTLPRLPPTHLEDSFVAGLAGWLAEVKPDQSYLTCLEGSGRLWEAKCVVFYVSGSLKRR